jgi:hypothetical protein
MNLLYVALDPPLHTHYSAGKVYPPHAMYPFPDNLNEVPSCTTCTNDNKRASANITHAILLKAQN